MKSFGKHTRVRLEKALTILLAFGILIVGCGKNTIPAGNGEQLAAAESVSVSTGEGIAEASAEDQGTTEAAELPEQEASVTYSRVIALSESNAELWLLAGGELIATSDDAMDIEGLNADAVSLGDMDHISLEAVAALTPDLLILFGTEPAQKALGESAAGLGIKVFYTDIDNFADYDAAMKELTGYTGDTEAYDRNVASVKAQIDEIVAGVPGGAEEQTYLFLHISSTKAKVEKDDYFASEIFNDLGLVNIAADDSSFDELSIEAIIAADPDYIFVVPRGNEEKAMASYQELFAGQPSWSLLSAVKNDRCYLLSKELFGMKPNAEWAEAYRQAFELLYGEP